MGHFRTVLAMFVVSFHATGAGATDGLPSFLPDGRTAVQLFFIVSGFYMALILNEKYVAGANWLFYSNRVARLWPSAFVVNVLVLVSFVVMGEVMLFRFEAGLPETWAFLRSLDVAAWLLLLCANVLLFGQDLLWFLRIDGSGITIAPFGLDAAHNGSSLSLNHPLFSVAIECWFYLVAPLVLRRGLAVTATLVGLGGSYHLILWGVGHRDLAWNYHLFVGGFYFFFLGALAYQVMSWNGGMVRAWLARHRTLALVGGGGLLLLQLASYPFGRTASIVMAVATAAALPGLFIATAKSRFDRLVGELSFGVYLVHFPLLIVMQQHVRPEILFSAVALLSILGAASLHVLLERPLDRWRQQRILSRVAARPSARDAAVAPPRSTVRATH